MGDELDVLRPMDTGISCRTKGLMAGRTWGVKAAEYWEWLGDALVTGKRLLGTKDMGQRAHSCQTCHVSQSAATLRGCGDRPAAARGSGEGAVSSQLLWGRLRLAPCCCLAVPSFQAAGMGLLFHLCLCSTNSKGLGCSGSPGEPLQCKQHVV